MAKRRTNSNQPSMPAKDRILETAQSLFYGMGVRAAGIDRVIAEAGVTKVTFYRHFPSKDVLIEAFLEKRHAGWIADFRELLAKYRDAQTSRQRRIAPLAPVLAATATIINAPTFRGCAFANTIAEVGPILPSVLQIAARHKREVCDAITALLPAHKDAGRIAWAATLALDGAIVNSQTGDQSAVSALTGLQTLLKALSGALQD